MGQNVALAGAQMPAKPCPCGCGSSCLALTGRSQAFCGPLMARSVDEAVPRERRRRRASSRVARGAGPDAAAGDGRAHPRAHQRRGRTARTSARWSTVHGTVPGEFLSTPGHGRRSPSGCCTCSTSATARISREDVWLDGGSIVEQLTAAGPAETANAPAAGTSTSLGACASRERSRPGTALSVGRSSRSARRRTGLACGEL